MLHKDNENHGTNDIPDQPVRIKEAARRLGVHPDTIRRWVETGKLKSWRHPINRYRLFDINELYRLLGQIFGHE